MPSPLLAVGAVLLLGACSTVEKLNPFGPGAPKTRPAELAAIQPTAELRSVWQASIGSAGEFTFSPAVVGDSVYAAAKDGAVARFDGGRQVWRIAAGQPISGGIGSDGKLVVVGTPKGEVLAFDAATGRETWKARVSSEVLAAPAVADGLAIVRSGDSRIFGFDAVDGKRRWVYQRSTPSLSLRSNVGVLLAGKVTLAGFPGGKLLAIANNNGAAVWEVTVALPKGTAPNRSPARLRASGSAPNLETRVSSVRFLYAGKYKAPPWNSLNVTISPVGSDLSAPRR